MSAMMANFMSLSHNFKPRNSFFASAQDTLRPEQNAPGPTRESPAERLPARLWRFGDQFNIAVGQIAYVPSR